jgi:hypothetical protein
LNQPLIVSLPGPPKIRTGGTPVPGGANWPAEIVSSPTPPTTVTPAAAENNISLLASPTMQALAAVLL